MISDFRTVQPQFQDVLRRMMRLGELREFVEYLHFLPDEWPVEISGELKVKVPHPHEGLDLAEWLSNGPH